MFYILLKRFIPIMSLAIIVACSNHPTGAKRGGQIKASKASASPFLLTSSFYSNDSIIFLNEDYGNYFLVIVDTSSNYFQLYDKMVHIRQRFAMEIDTMGRYYNIQKNKIILPEDDEDEIYAGEYFPRRWPSEHLSLEYLNFYDDESNDATIALVAGIYENVSQADSLTELLKKSENNAFTLPSSIYIGCMH